MKSAKAAMSMELLGRKFLDEPNVIYRGRREKLVKVCQRLIDDLNVKEEEDIF